MVAGRPGLARGAGAFVAGREPIDNAPAAPYASRVPTLGRILCLLAALAVIEVPYLAMQAYAWGTMVHERAPEMGLEAAVADTLSGASPCSKCLALEGEREKKQERAPIEEKRQLCLLIPAGRSADPGAALSASVPVVPTAALRQNAPSRADDVPTPPPRVS